jgi:hypothetical protein
VKREIAIIFFGGTRVPGAFRRLGPGIELLQRLASYQEIARVGVGWSTPEEVRLIPMLGAD